MSLKISAIDTLLRGSVKGDLLLFKVEIFSLETPTR